jgi:hypothetical protein
MVWPHSSSVPGDHEGIMNNAPRDRLLLTRTEVATVTDLRLPYRDHVIRMKSTKVQTFGTIIL